jgi:hypothetical protein
VKLHADEIVCSNGRLHVFGTVCNAAESAKPWCNCSQNILDKLNVCYLLVADSSVGYWRVFR